jgi:hypothetical protein
MKSESLRHFPHLDPVPRHYSDEKNQARQEINSQTDEYLARGGQIQEVGSEANRNPQFMIGNVIRRGV